MIFNFPFYSLFTRSFGSAGSHDLKVHTKQFESEKNVFSEIMMNDLPLQCSLCSELTRQGFKSSLDGIRLNCLILSFFHIQAIESVSGYCFRHQGRCHKRYRTDNTKNS